MQGGECDLGDSGKALGKNGALFPSGHWFGTRLRSFTPLLKDRHAGMSVFTLRN